MDTITREPILGPDSLNGMLEQLTSELLPMVRVMFRNVYPKGLMVGQEREKDAGVRLRTLMGTHDRNITMIGAMDPTFAAQLGVPPTFPGDAKRAQDELFEEETLKREVFGNASIAAPVEENA